MWNIKMKASQALENIIQHLISIRIHQHQPTYHMHDKCVVEIFNVTDLECLRFRVCFRCEEEECEFRWENRSSLAFFLDDYQTRSFFIAFLRFFSKQLEKKKENFLSNYLLSIFTSMSLRHSSRMCVFLLKIYLNFHLSFCFVIVLLSVRTSNKVGISRRGQVAK